jgi:cytoskeleton-associated protein 5
MFVSNVKVGDSKETIRQRVRAIMRQICRVYPASKFFGYLVTALASKNVRTRSECLEELGSLVQRNGLSVCNPAKILPSIASNIADRDSTVRTAAINVVIQFHSILGDATFKYIGKLSDKDRSFLDEKLKRSKISSSPSKSSVQPKKSECGDSSSVKVVAAPRTSEDSHEHASGVDTGPARKFSLEFDSLTMPKLSTASEIGSLPSTETPVSLMAPTPSFQRQRQTSVRTAAPVHSEYVIDFLLTQISGGDAFQSIDALKQLERSVSTQTDLIKDQLNPILNSIILQVRLEFTSLEQSRSESATTSIRLCKHLINVLVQIFTVNELALALNKETMHQLFSELLYRLIDSSLAELGESGTQLTRALNVLMIRVLENCHKNSVYRYFVSARHSFVVFCLISWNRLPVNWTSRKLPTGRRRLNLPN